ncbi:hypothetical protein HNQ56_001845 [Anaerotaenia torta]|uniref:Ig-like domain-containing protein n=1 Tax=Anaerotaenia torta TaxID=433293 RepID=UPI003D23A87A
MKYQRTKLLKVIVSFLLVMGLLLPSQLPAASVQAAAKTTIDSEMMIGTGSTWSEFGVYQKDAKYVLEVSNPVKKATYSFKSSDEKVLKLKASGTKVYLTGLKKGSATITCSQKLNGKTTKVGTCKVTVVDPSLYAEEYDGLPLGTASGMFIYYECRNNDATYTFTSSDKNFSMKEKVVKSELMNGYYPEQTYTAKKAGTYTVTVKETYNKKTRTVGKLKFVVKKASVAKEYGIDAGEIIGAFSLVNNARADVKYYFEADDTGVVIVKADGDGFILEAKKPGTATVKVYENASSAAKDKLIGSCKVTVKELKAEDLSCDLSSDETYVGDDAIILHVYKEPYNAPEAITVTSSDSSIAEVGELDEDGRVEITPVGEGTVKITITCGEITKTETITVYADEDAMYGW